jgi:hypothetical protein
MTFFRCTYIVFLKGNIAVGNLHHFLPVIVKMVEHDPAKRLLSLHALKEVATHCSHGQLENVADLLWVPLFQNSEDSEEITRNVAAACLGKVAMTVPSRYLPQLHVSGFTHLYVEFLLLLSRNVSKMKVLRRELPSSLLLDTPLLSLLIHMMSFWARLLWIS